MARKRISQAEIARTLGVSQALVSMVLNGRKEGIAPATVQRIWKYAIESGYAPKGMRVEALNESRIQRHAVGYFLRAPLRLATTSNFFSHVSQGLHDCLTERDLNMVFLGAESDYGDSMARRVRSLLPTLRGIVVLGEVEPEFRNWVQDLKLPVVMVSGRASGIFHSVNSNEHQATSLLVEHLAELGHKRFAYIGGQSPKGRNADRLAALQQTLQRRKLQLKSKDIVVEPEADRVAGYEAAGKLLAKRKAGERASAWIFVNALMARGAASRLRTEGLMIGRDVHLAAIDMTRVCEEENPQLTSAAAVPEEMGREAGRLLVEAGEADGLSLRDLVVPAKLVVRDSTGPYKPAVRVKR